MAMKLLLSLLAVLATLSPGLAQPKPVRLIAEAEDFTPKDDGWAVVPYRENYFASTFAVTFLSRMAALGAPAQLNAPAVAEQKIEVPVTDEFQILVRYEQPYQYAVEFTVEVEQNGKVLASHLCGRLQDPKIWPLNGRQRVPMERFWWGGTDNIVWQQPGAVKLAAGPATLRLIAREQLNGGKPRVNAGRRSIDVVCLTNDLAGIEAQKKTRYLEMDGWLVQDGDLFVRVTNPKDGLGACVPLLTPETNGQHSPYYVHIRDWPTTRVLKTGHVTDATTFTNDGPRSRAADAANLSKSIDGSTLEKPDPKKKAKAGPGYAIPDELYLQPGDVSGWVPLGPLVDSMNNCIWTMKAEYAGKVAGLHLKLEFAIPDGKGGLKPIKEYLLKEPTSFEIPGNIAPNPRLAAILKERYWLPEIRSVREALDWLNSEVAKFPAKGSVPKRFLVYGIMEFGNGLSYASGQKLAVALGSNTLAQPGVKNQLMAHWPDPKVDAIKAREAKLPNGLTDVRIVSYGDEIHLPALPVTDEEFAAWLKERGIKYDGEVKFINVNRKMTTEEAIALKQHPLYYYSQICAKEKGGRLYAEGTAYYATKGVSTGANYSPHANYLVTEMDYIRTFKLRAMSLPWSEDYVWQIPEFSVQAMGYLTSGLRAGAKYDNLPILMYVMPHSPGNTPRDFRLSFYSAVAHGAKMVHYFCGSPMAVGATENYVATDDLGTFRQIHAVSHEAGTFEDYVIDGKVRPAKVGLLLSAADDILTGVGNETFAMHNNERKAIWYALRHAQVPVDFLSEDDVIEGRAKGYDRIYVTQQYLTRSVVRALKNWVEAGGTLVAHAGGGCIDEFRKENPEALALYGLKSQKLTTDPLLISKYLLKENTPFLTKQDLPLYEPIDDMQGIPVIVWKQQLEAADGVVDGKFRDGKPALVRRALGKGETRLWGFLPGQAYLKSGLPPAPVDRGSTDAAFAHRLPTTMDPGLRKLVTGTSNTLPVECSEPLVETTCIDTMKDGKPFKLAVPLMNYTGKPIAKLTVRIRDAAPAVKVRSVERGTLTAKSEGNDLVIELPLDIADMLLIDR